MSWTSVKFRDVAQIERITVNANDIAEGETYVGLENITSQGEFVGVKSVSADELKSNKFIFNPKHVLFGKLRPYLAKIARPTFSGICSTDILPIRTGPNIDPDFLFRYLRTPEFISLASERAAGVNLPRLSPNVLLDFEIPLPPLPIQKKIAAVLEKADELRRKREEQIKRLDDLLQATFLDMFGDPVTNPKGWNMVKLGEISHKITDGVHAKPNYTADGKPFISVVNITSGKIIFDNCKFVSEADFEKFTKVNKPEYGDILYTKVGTYGIPAFVDVKDDFCLYVSVSLIKPNHDLINSQFLAVSMGMPYVKRQADSRIKGIGVPDLHLNQIREFDICCPPSSLQQKFVDFCSKIDEQMTRLRKQLNGQKSFFSSLMQRAFKGELDLK